jgi:hypothetical protein
MDEPAGNLENARKYLQALERGETGAALSSFLAPDMVLAEFPNRLTPRQEARPGGGSGRRGTGQDGHVPSDI